MISQLVYKRLAGICLALGLLFLVVVLLDRPASMGSGILNFLLIISSAACSTFFAGMWLFKRTREQERISLPYGIMVGVLFALAASMIVLMGAKIGIVVALMTPAISALLAVALYYGTVLLAGAVKKRKSPIYGFVGALILSGALAALYCITLP